MDLLPSSYGWRRNGYFLCSLAGIAVGLWPLHRQVGVGFIHWGLEVWNSGTESKLVEYMCEPPMAEWPMGLTPPAPWREESGPTAQVKR